MNETLATVLVGIFGITGSLLLLSSALAMYRVREIGRASCRERV